MKTVAGVTALFDALDDIVKLLMDASSVQPEGERLMTPSAELRSYPAPESCIDAAEVSERVEPLG